MSDLAQLLARVRWQDALDVILLTLIAFRAFQLLRGTVALQVLTGMGALLLAALAASVFELVLMAYVLQALGAVAVFAAVVIFQVEIRRTLRRADPTRWWRGRRGRRVAADREPVRILARALSTLATQRTGALVVLPREDELEEYVTGGTGLDAVLSSELFASIFHVNAPVHDGAALVLGNRVKKAGVLLPLSTSNSIPDSYGTRHRAALGLSEASDAVILVVSEERGEISLAMRGQLTIAPRDPEQLAAFIEKAIGTRNAQAVSRGATRSQTAEPHPRRRLLENALALALIFMMVTGAWYALAGDQSTIITMQRPIEMRGARNEKGIELLRPMTGEVTVNLRGPRRLLYSRARSEVVLWVDLSKAEPGRNRLPIQSSTPAGLNVVSAEPSHAVVHLREPTKNDPP